MLRDDRETGQHARLACGGVARCLCAVARQSLDRYMEQRERGMSCLLHQLAKRAIMRA